MAQHSWRKLDPDSDHDDSSVNLLNARPDSLKLKMLKKRSQATTVFLGAVLFCIVTLSAISFLCKRTNLDQLCNEHTSQYC